MKVTDWLTPANFAAQQIDIIAKRQAGTGLWLLNSPEYNEWVHGKAKTMFCPGIPGAGKSMTASVVVDHLQATFLNDPDVGIACLFCNYKRRAEQTSSDLLAGLLKQLVQQLRSMPKEVEVLYEKHTKTKTRPPFAEITSVLRACLSHFSKLYFVVDALDECENSAGDRYQLLHEIFHLQGDHEVRLFATSRFVPDVEKEFGESIQLEIRASAEDVGMYLSGQMG